MCNSANRQGARDYLSAHSNQPKCTLARTHPPVQQSVGSPAPPPAFESAPPQPVCQGSPPPPLAPRPQPSRPPKHRPPPVKRPAKRHHHRHAQGAMAVHGEDASTAASQPGARTRRRPPAPMVAVSAPNGRSASASSNTVASRDRAAQGQWWGRTSAPPATNTTSTASGRGARASGRP